MPDLAVMLNVRGRLCLVVGGGKVALRRVRSLVSCGAMVTVVAQCIHPELVALSEQHGGRSDTPPLTQGESEFSLRSNQGEGVAVYGTNVFDGLCVHRPSPSLATEGSATLSQGERGCSEVPRVELNNTSPTESTHTGQANPIKLLTRAYQSGDMEHAWLVVIATDDAKVNQQVHEDARRSGVLINRSDEPAMGDVQLAAHARQGPITVSVHTDGISAAAAARIRDELMRELDPAWAVLLEVVRPYRESIQLKYESAEARTEKFTGIDRGAGHDVVAESWDRGLAKLLRVIAAR
ncbi:MAG: bifunctional precorrin-2 dehydrogenase/sirohydrochlorin ferrochelatase [Phycisphaerales bacterium]|nr:bifunctional precorrin-2 dehydrogenase/sirohydrochlorin ferrochelatase [Phycisphaerales bacterium]